MSQPGTESVNTESVAQRLKPATGAAGVLHSGNVRQSELTDGHGHWNNWRRNATGTAGVRDSGNIRQSELLRD